MPNTTTPTLYDAVLAQAEFVSKYTAQIAEHGYGDDDVDYLPGALELLVALQSDHYGSLSGGPTDARESRRVVLAHGCYAGDYGPQSVFDAIGLPDGAVQ